MPTFMVDVDFSVYCAKCGAGLCGNRSTDDKRMKMDVEPCDKCLENARDDGYSSGHDEGYQKGIERGGN